MQLDHDRWLFLAGGAFGTAFFAMVRISASLLSGQTPTVQETRRAFANIMLGVLCGLIAAPILGPGLAPVVPIASLRDPLAVGFVVGGLAWEIAPFLVSWAQRWVGNQSKGAGQ